MVPPKNGFLSLRLPIFGSSYYQCFYTFGIAPGLLMWWLYCNENLPPPLVAHLCRHLQLDRVHLRVFIRGALKKVKFGFPSFLDRSWFFTTLVFLFGPFMIICMEPVPFPGAVHSGDLAPSEVLLTTRSWLRIYKFNWQISPTFGCKIPLKYFSPPGIGWGT